METRNEHFVTGVSVPPGYTLKRLFEDRGYTQKQFAEAIGMRPSHLCELIKGKRKVTPNIADDIVRVLGGKPMFWLKLQARYEYNVIALQEREVEEAAASAELNSYNAIIDLRTIVKRTYDDLMESPLEMLNHLQKVLGIPNPAELQYSANGLFKKSAKTGLDPRMLMTWIVLAQAAAKREKPSIEFDKACEKDLICECAQVLHKNENTISAIKSALNRYGIGFCVVEKVDKASVDGFSYWEGNIPIIVVSKRYNRIDNLAFTIMHELGHIFLHEKGTYINIQDYETAAKGLDLEADDYANNALIPNKVWKTLPDMPMNSYLIQRRCFAWAQSHSLNKWIVCGRVSNATGMYKFKADKERYIN